MPRRQDNLSAQDRTRALHGDNFEIGEQLL